MHEPMASAPSWVMPCLRDPVTVVSVDCSPVPQLPSCLTGDLDPMSKQPFMDELQPCTAPLGPDVVAAGCLRTGGHPSLRLAPLGSQQQKQQQQSGRGKSGQQQAGANNGNTLLKFGFVRGLAKPAPASDFRPPRASSAQPSSQDSGAAAAAQAEGCRQEAPGASSQEEAEPVPASPAAARPAPAGDVLASPTEEQWESFRQRRHRVSGKAPAAAPAAAARASRKSGSATTSSYFGGKPSVPGIRKPAAASGAGSLLARLRAALQPEEPSIDELLSRWAF